MKFTCNRELLSDALNKVTRAVSPRSTIAALEGIYFRTEECSLYICGYNLELGISTKILANIYEEGSIVLSNKLFCEIVRKMPGDELEITCGENFITTIKSSEAEYSIIGISPSDFPELPVIEGDRRISVSQGMLKSMIGQTIFAVSDNDTRPTCTGSLFEVSEDKIRIVSVDGFRLAIRTEPITGTVKMSFIVPKRTLEEVSRLLEDDEEKRVEICATRRHIEFVINGCVIISRLIEGEFLDYHNAIPQNTTTEVRVNTRRMIEATERMNLL
ncbi:MAG: DNA polymerase III subunit beta, partial [Clostridia bacterium]|nr:DNA polymerase III subunit beta [Clostridia bacterium]